MKVWLGGIVSQQAGDIVGESPWLQADSLKTDGGLSDVLDLKE